MSFSFLLLLLQLLCCLLPLIPRTHAAAIYFDVNTCNEQNPCIHVAPTGKDINNGTIDFPFRNIQRALNYINQTTTLPTKIVLADGIYPGNIVWNGKSVTLTSISGAASTFIDCNRIPNQRGIWLGSGETSTTVVSGVTIRNCRNQMGAGIAVVGETTKPIIRDVVLLNNSATMGGGMLIYFASPSLIGVNFTANQARDGAGLMITHNASMIISQQLQAMSLALNYIQDENKPIPSGATAAVPITDSTFNGNIGVGIGAGYYLMAAYRVSCSRCTFIGGNASGSGAIAAGIRSTLSISDSNFMDNRAMTANGGAVSIQQGSSATIIRSIFNNNEAKNGNGGGVAVGTTGTATITNCQFNNNRATMGSIVFIDATARAQVNGCTCTNNVAFQQGGILYLSPQAARNANVSTNTFSNNLALGGYAADYGSFPAQLVFVPNTNTEIGATATTPSLLPINSTTSVTRSINNLDEISLRILLLDTFGQRIDLNSSNQTDLYADVMTLDNVTVPALLVESTRVRMPQGLADVSVVLVGEAGATYAVTWSVAISGVEPIRLLVTILPCDPHAVITYYDQTTFPICHPAQSHFISSSFFTGIVIISCILIALVLIVQGLTIWYWTTPVFKTSTPLFMSLMLVGAIIGYLSTILSVIDVDRTSNGLSLFNQLCKTQYWMMGIAFVLMFATLALKTWRIRNIFCNSQLTEIRTVNTFALFRWLMGLIALEMLIHIVWISTDPLHAVMRLNGTRVAATCESSNATAFLITNLVYKGVIALVCVLFAYQTRDVTSRFNESRQLMIASYNMFVCVIVIATLSLALPDVDARRIVYSVGSLFVITSTWFVLFAPKLYVAIFHPHQNTSLGIATGTGASGGKNSNSGGKNSNNSAERKISKGSHYQLQSSSKTSNGNTSSSPGTATPTRSKMASPANTAPGSPIIPAAHRLSLNLGSVRSSVSTMPTPISPKMSPPLTILRHLSIERETGNTPKIVMTVDEMNGLPALELITIQQERRASTPAIYDHDTPAPGTGHGHSTESGHSPAKNFI